jgi:hypothetical protein
MTADTTSTAPELVNADPASIESMRARAAARAFRRSYDTRRQPDHAAVAPTRAGQRWAGAPGERDLVMPHCYGRTGARVGGALDHGRVQTSGPWFPALEVE